MTRRVAGEETEEEEGVVVGVVSKENEEGGFEVLLGS